MEAMNNPVALYQLTANDLQAIIERTAEKTVEIIIQRKNKPLDGELLTRKETAAFFKRNERTVDEWAASGLITPIKLGRHVYYSRKEIDRIIANPKII